MTIWTLVNCDFLPHFVVSILFQRFNLISGALPQRPNHFACITLVALCAIRTIWMAFSRARGLWSGMRNLTGSFLFWDWAGLYEELLSDQVILLYCSIVTLLLNMIKWSSEEGNCPPLRRTVPHFPSLLLLHSSLTSSMNNVSLSGLSCIGKEQCGRLVAGYPWTYCSLFMDDISNMSWLLFVLYSWLRTL